MTALIEIGMPRLSDSMEEATVLKWLRRPGEAVKRGEPLVEVETDKATVVYDAESDGILEEIVVDEGGSAQLGAPIARLRVEGAAPVASAPAPAPVSAGSGRARATPVARRLARDLGVDLSAVGGSGPGGRIVGSDVQAAIPSGPPPAGGRGTVDEQRHTPTQRTIAQRMSESRSSIPEFTIGAELDMEGVARLRADLRAGGVEPLPSYNDLVVRAVALALRDFPNLNAGYGDDSTLRWSRINVGVAVATDDALLVPTVFDADAKSVVEIARETRRLAERARSRSLTGDELADGTFTVSNLGMFGVLRFDAVINHPQAAILAVGEVSERPVVREGALAAGLLCEVALSCDHRVVYGAEAARFLQRVRELLEHAALLLIDEGAER